MLRHNCEFRQNGESLVEILIGIAVGSILLTGVIFSVSKIIVTNIQVMQTSRLNMELNYVLSKMTNDIRRAGYWNQASTGVDVGTNINPYMTTGSTNLSVTGSCILLAYDVNKDGVIPGLGTGTDDERYGYRLLNNYIQARTYNAGFTCASSATGWVNITDPKSIQITNLVFTTTSTTTNISGTGSGSPSITVRNIKIDITGRLTNNPSLITSLTKTVHVYNNRFSP